VIAELDGAPSFEPQGARVVGEFFFGLNGHKSGDAETSTPFSPLTMPRLSEDKKSTGRGDKFRVLVSGSANALWRKAGSLRGAKRLSA
jgi:hypothetical protein